jgi:hypothetical protein
MALYATNLIQTPILNQEMAICFLEEFMAVIIFTLII